MSSAEPFFFPEAKEWMWSYCIFLGPFEWEGQKYDLGVCYNPQTGKNCAAIVCSNQPWDYLSGMRNLCEDADPVYKETFRRWDAYRSGESIENVWKGQVEGQPGGN